MSADQIPTGIVQLGKRTADIVFGGYTLPAMISDNKIIFNAPYPGQKSVMITYSGNCVPFCFFYFNFSRYFILQSSFQNIQLLFGSSVCCRSSVSSFGLNHFIQIVSVFIPVHFGSNLFF